MKNNYPIKYSVIGIYDEINRNTNEPEYITYIASNIVMNIFGLGNAATPFGLKAFEELQKDNPKKDTATRSMITFLVMNTSGLTLIPVSVIGMRLSYGSINPTNVIIPTIIATSINTFIALLVDYLIRRKHIE